MAISNFKLPTGLEVSGSTVLTGTLDVSGLVNVTTLTASVGVSGAVGNFNVLNVNTLSAPSLNLAGDLTVSGTTNLGDSSTDVINAVAQLSASNGIKVLGGVLDASTVAVSASALNVTNDISARSASLTGDLTVQGKLTVNNMLYVDTTTVNVGDTNINLGTGSSTLSVLNGGGIDLGTNAEVQWRYDNGNSAWTSNKNINASAGNVYQVAGTTALGGGSLGLVSGVYMTSGSLLSPTNPGKLTISSNGSSSLSGSSEINLTAPKVFVGSAVVTTASLNAASYVGVGNALTAITYINGVNTTVYGSSGASLVGANTLVSGSTSIQLSGATSFNSNLSGPTGSFNVLTGSTTTGSLATFTTVSASQISASTILVNSMNPNYIYEGATNFLTISAGATGTIDQFAWATYEAGKYLVKAKEQGGQNWVHVVEIIVATDGTYNYMTPYGSTYTSTSSLLQFISDPIVDANTYVKLGNLSSQSIVVKWIKTYITK